ncbi:hypothetical protein SOVF_070790 [Spinacia oleracea]|nr:hypothetical protein SOVF_070790 [Spinacia oleracea]
MERLLKDFNLPPNAPEDVRVQWWKVVGSLILNRRRRFRYVTNLKKRSQDAKTLQVFMFLAVDFDLDNAGGLSCCNAVLKLLRYLNTEDGIQKIHGFDEMVAGC